MHCGDKYVYKKEITGNQCRSYCEQSETFKVGSYEKVVSDKKSNSIISVRLNKDSAPLSSLRTMSEMVKSYLISLPIGERIGADHIVSSLRHLKLDHMKKL